MANSLFETIAKAQVLGGGTYLGPNQEGILTIAQVGLKSGYKGQSAIFKFIIEKARPLIAGGPVQEPGSRVSAVQNLTKPGVAGDMAQANTLTIYTNPVEIHRFSTRLDEEHASIVQRQLPKP